MRGYECDICGLAQSDLPDGVNPEAVFECESGRTWCLVHSDSDVQALVEGADR